MNFIFFNPDELRAESVGCYGHPLAPTPNMDALAAQGTRFDQCHVQHTVCTPSRCSFMTGWYPHVRGHRTLWHLLRPDEPNLLRYLKSAGYDVRWWGKNDLLSEESLAESVTSAERRGSGLFGPPAFNPNQSGAQSFLFEAYEGELEEHGDYANVQGAIDYLHNKEDDQPFFLYLPLTFPHCPYSAPQPWHDLIDPDELPPLRPADLPDRPEFHELVRKSRQLDGIDEAILRKIQAVYLGMTGFVDMLLGRLLTTLEETGHAEDTTIVFFSDHGDYAGDYGLVEKWPSGVEDVLTRVPLIIRTPDGIGGHVIDTPIELFDIMATTLDLADVECEHDHFAYSLQPQLHGEEGDPDRAAFTEGGYAYHEPHCFEGAPARDQFARNPYHIYYPKGLVQQQYPDSVGRVVAIRTASHKLVHRPVGVNELYDMKADPLELNNRYGDVALLDVQRSLEARLLDWYIETSDVTPYNEDPRGLPEGGVGIR